MNRFTNLTRTTAFRLTALYMLLFGIVAAGLTVYMTRLSLTMLTDQTQVSLHEELRSIESAYLHGSIPLLVKTIDRRSRQPGAFLYLVADPEGHILAGNVANIDSTLLANEGMLKNPFTYYRYGETGNHSEHKAIAAIVNLPNNMKLLVGRDLGEPQRYSNIIRQALGIALAAMAFGAFLIWFFIGRRALLRIDKVSQASQRLMDGDLSGRLPVLGSGDEFDRLSSNLNIMLDRIEELNSGLRQVSDNIAHDLKTPLTRLRNRAEEALSGKKKINDFRNALNEVITESDQLIRTFNAILMISRIEASRSLEHLEPMNARLIVDDVVELYEPMAEESGVRLTLGEIFSVELKLSRELFAQSLFNLIDNAIKYAARERDHPTVTVSMEDTDKNILVIVTDNGPGIPEEDRERATERFVRLDKSRTRPGFGIGLSLAKAVMKLHGGHLILEDAHPGLRAILAFPKIIGFETQEPNIRLVKHEEP